MAKNNNESGDIYQITLPKCFTFDDANRFNKMLLGCADNDCPVVAMDLCKTEFMDSAGLGMLLLARDTVEKMGKSIILLNPQGYVKKLFTMSRFGEIFTIEEVSEE